MIERKSSQRSTIDGTTDADVVEVRSTIEAFPRDLHELQARCRSLTEAVELGDADRIAQCANEVSVALQTARATLGRASGPRPRAPGGYISLCAAETIVGHLFRRALQRLRGGSAGEVRACITLHHLASVLELDVDPAAR